jgi:uracil-DNA glycosylase
MQALQQSLCFPWPHKRDTFVRGVLRLFFSFALKLKMNPSPINSMSAYDLESCLNNLKKLTADDEKDTDEMMLSKYVESYRPRAGWKPLFDAAIKKGEFPEISISDNVFPAAHQIFAAFEHFKPQDTRVVIIGQDPYHTRGMAHGLCFSTLSKKIPPSLANIFQELANDGFQRNIKNGNLTSWAKQGVMMLNASLTVDEGKANSHKGKYDAFITRAIKFLDKATPQGMVVILWGGFAHKLKKKFDQAKNKFIESAHPSPLSVTKFRGSKPFSKCNDLLAELNLEPIDWSA